MSDGMYVSVMTTLADLCRQKSNQVFESFHLVLSFQGFAEVLPLNPLLLVFLPCLHSVGKSKPSCVSLHNTVSTASASDCFTASLAQSRLRGLQQTALPPIHNLRMTHVHNEFVWMAMSIQRNADQRFFFVYNQPCQLFNSAWYFSVRQKPAGFSLQSLHFLTKMGEENSWEKRAVCCRVGLLSPWSEYCNVKTKKERGGTRHKGQRHEEIEYSPAWSDRTVSCREESMQSYTVSPCLNAQDMHAYTQWKHTQDRVSMCALAPSTWQRKRGGST